MESGAAWLTFKHLAGGNQMMYGMNSPGMPLETHAQRIQLLSHSLHLTKAITDLRL